MEFFAVAASGRSPGATKLTERLDIPSLPRHCDSILEVESHHGNEGEIFCVWGHFTLHRQPIKGGVRFSLPGCPNGLAWTITTGLPPAPDSIVIHCTIARREAEADFVESLKDFVAHWREGIELAFPQEKGPSPSLDDLK